MWLEAFNIKRRLRTCEQGHKFWTIELPEAEFERLRTARGGGFDPPMGGMR